jgi:hypothetical protein
MWKTSCGPVLALCALCYGADMMKRWTARLDANDVRALEEIGRERGGLSVSKVIRLAVAEYIANESKRMKAARQPLYGQGVGKPLWMDADAE